MAEARKAAMIRGVEGVIAYTFQNNSILWEALQAPGAVPYSTQGRDFTNGNKRLALLGDAILKAVLLEEWYSTTKDIRAGNDAVAVKGSNTNLAMVCGQHGIENFVNKNNSQGSIVSVGTMAQTIEAILGAVWLDSTSLHIVRAVMVALNLA